MKHPVLEALRLVIRSRKILQKVAPMLREFKKRVRGDAPRQRVQGELNFSRGAVSFLREAEHGLRELRRRMGRKA